MLTPPFRTWADISAAALVRNFFNIQALVGQSVTVAPVVKANAYGHGAVKAAAVLERAGASWFAVSNVAEGVELRESGIGGQILILGDFLPYEQPTLVQYRLTPALHSIGQITEWEESCRQRGEPLPFHLDVDSGMSRLGAQHGPVLGELLSTLRYARCQGVMTHLASANDFSSPQTEAQLICFERVFSDLRERGVTPPHVHMASSVALAYGLRRAWGTFVRPGLALYGYVGATRGPRPASLLDVVPVLTWKARILEIKDLPAGALVGYNGSYLTRRPTRMAIIAVGYADGLPHALSNRGKVIAGGAWAPVIGSVSMDVTAIDITECPPLERGSAVTLVGKEGELTMDARQVAEAAGTVTHDILSGLGSRVHRIFHPAEA